MNNSMKSSTGSMKKALILSLSLSKDCNSLKVGCNGEGRCCHL
ncbi:unnamed protein product [Fusarium graminearum]|uniref:Chromosome 1, complete genome n=1 Tax=Gibberella zeae (strain ATCC MYA-4620 / CBS 123657 / FGSC 9075 / NRRL 31084 / PH-1) TaxID=229533 RepID=A0A0E0RPY0_GIBZE|nr:hypothetical protein FG05_35401 [Fusarium graminearum]CEF73305.1 unnamed protein product [Fusarium graminearum]CZS76576.1 unnamed protein product [Fusarium graminearum]